MSLASEADGGAASGSVRGGRVRSGEGGWRQQTRRGGGGDFLLCTGVTSWGEDATRSAGGTKREPLSVRDKVPKPRRRAGARPFPRPSIIDAAAAGCHLYERAGVCLCTGASSITLIRHV